MRLWCYQLPIVDSIQDRLQNFCSLQCIMRNLLCLERLSTERWDFHLLTLQWFNTCWKSRQNPTDGAKKSQGRLSPPTICLAAKNWTNQNRREALFVEGASDGFKTALALLVENGDSSMYLGFQPLPKRISVEESSNKSYMSIKSIETFSKWRHYNSL